MERHANKNNAPETIKVPLQQLSKSGKTIFAYMRRSTTKKEQASSLGQQEDGVGILANSLGIPLESIVCYSESKSAYEDRTRAEWKRMLIDIDNLKEPCTILCRDTSRLSRNPEDNGNIRTRLFGKRGQKEKPKIENIYFLSESLTTQNWNMSSDREEVETVLHNNYMESLRTGKKSATGILLKLKNKELPYPPPSGIYRVTKNNEEIYKKTLHEGEETILIQNEKMPFIKRAFEMKIEGKPAKEISKYLKQYGGIIVQPKKITESIIQNTIYKGEYTHNTTGEIFSLKFKEGQLPIDSILWDKANKTIGKRGHGFGEGQKDHIAKDKLKSETGKTVIYYLAKGKYRNYGVEITSEDGNRETINISEIALIKQFLAESIPKIYTIYHNIYKEESTKFCDMILDELENGNKMTNDSRAELEHYLDTVMPLVKNAEEIIPFIIAQKSLDMTIGLAKQSPAFDTVREKKIMEEQRKIEIERMIGEKEQKKTTIEDDAFDRGFDINFVKRKQGALQEEIENLKSELQSIGEHTDIEQFISRLPEIVYNLHELANRVLPDADYEECREEIKKLIAIISHELTLTNKKELKVKLFDGFEKLEMIEKENGATYGTRTHDLSLTMGMLYQLS